MLSTTTKVLLWLGCLVLIASTVSAAPWGGLKLVNLRHKYREPEPAPASPCTDDCMTKWATNSTADCFKECQCPEFSKPTMQDLFTQNQCYTESEKCLLLPTTEEIRACYGEYAWECNKFCISQCHAIGLNTTCDSNWGCVRPAPAAANATSDVATVVAAVATPVNRVTSGTTVQTPIDSLTSVTNVVSNQTERSVIAETQEFLDLEFSAPQKDEYKSMMAEIQPEGWQPPCWRKCLQMAAPKDTVFSCINDCGCANESPHLITLQKSSVIKPTPVESSLVMALLGLILIFILIIGGLSYLKYKQEVSKGRRQSSIFGMGEEEGYERLK